MISLDELRNVEIFYLDIRSGLENIAFVTSFNMINTLKMNCKHSNRISYFRLVT